MLAEVAAAGLPDWRLNKRLQILVERFTAAPEQSIPQVMGKRDFKAAYAFLDNDRVTHSAIVAGQRQASLERVERELERGCRTVLLVQDSSSFNFKAHPATEGLGSLENQHTSGFLTHSTLAISADGVPLGLIDQQVWVRDRQQMGKSGSRHERAFVDKESYKWVRGLPELCPQREERDIQWVTIADREAHIYEFFAEVLDRDQQALVRASRGRSFTSDGLELFAAVSQLPVEQHYSLHLTRHPEREEREAQVELRFGSITLVRPKRAETERETVTLWVVEVKEPHPPQGEQAIHWVLLTTLPVATLAAAQQIVQWYSYRWLIERFHYVLKSGCHLEERQLRTQPRLERLLAVFDQVAWHLLWLTYQARVTPERDCLVALDMDEWQALYATIHQTTDLPTMPPTLHEAVGWIAQLGGFLGRAGDGEPGVKVLWRGWTRLQDIVATWRLLRPSRDNGNA